MNHNLADSIRAVDDFPKENIVFRDITTLLNDKDAYRLAINQLEDYAKKYDFNVIAAIEARGFYFWWFTSRST